MYPTEREKAGGSANQQNCHKVYWSHPLVNSHAILKTATITLTHKDHSNGHSWHSQILKAFSWHSEILKAFSNTDTHQHSQTLWQVEMSLLLEMTPLSSTLEARNTDVGANSSGSMHCGSCAERVHKSIN